MLQSSLRQKLNCFSGSYLPSCFIDGPPFTTYCRFRYLSRHIVRNASHVSKSSASAKAVDNCQQHKQVQCCPVLLPLKITLWFVAMASTFPEAPCSPARWRPHEPTLHGEVLGPTQLNRLRHRRRLRRRGAQVPAQVPPHQQGAGVSPRAVILYLSILAMVARWQI